MATIKRFEELDAWKLFRRLVARFYEEQGNGTTSKDFASVDQTIQSSNSIRSNHAEGFERNGIRDFVHFCDIAKASEHVFRAQSYIAFDVGYFSEKPLNKLLCMDMETSKSIAGMIRYPEAYELKGSEFAEPDQNYIIESGLFSAAPLTLN